MYVLCSPTKMPLPSIDFVWSHLNNDHTPSETQFPAPPGFSAQQSTPRQGRYHLNSAYIYGKAQNTLERLAAESTKQDEEIGRARQKNIYYPFSDRGGWELGKFMCENLNKGQITRFLKLEWFQTRVKPSFKSVDELFSWMDTLPQGPRWRCTKIEMDDYVTTNPVYLLWRDALEVTEMIFGNPIFQQHMCLDPHEVYTGQNDHEYTEWMSSQEAFRIQDSLPIGATMVPIILASDKTPVTRHTGSLEMHPLFLTIGNIRSDLRMKATAHAWSCVAYMPMVRFVTHSDYSGVLQARLWHRCMDIVCNSLKSVAARGAYMADPGGFQCYCFTPLAGYIADLPEQLMVACVAQNASPVTLATKTDFSSATPCPPRSGLHTLQLIHRLASHINPWKVREFLAAAKELFLSGVHLPFWRDWRFADPAKFLTPEILHTLHKFFFDHILKWCKEGLGADELDARYKSQHKRVGTRHFSHGVSHVKQMTGREHRDMQRTIVATIAGPVPSDFVCAVRAAVDFIYKAQAPSFTDSSIASMVESLAEFHSFKQSVIDAELRRGQSGPIDHFEIPKLELFHSFAPAIHNAGAPIQFTADVSERLLITHCKNPFERTSHQCHTFSQQIIRLLDREERMRQFHLFTLLSQCGASLKNFVDQEFDEMADLDPTLAWILRVSPEDHVSFSQGRRIRNHFLKGIVSDDARVAAHVTVNPHQRNKTLVWVSSTYQLPNLATAVLSFVSQLGFSSYRDTVNVWNAFRLQLVSAFDGTKVMPSQQVQALPPSPGFALGKCDTVLLYNPSEEALPLVAQVRVVFAFRETKKDPLPTALKEPLLYVEFFEVFGGPDDTMRMYRLRRKVVHGPGGHPQRAAAIIPITAVTHAVELIPIYGARHNRQATTNVSLEMYDEFYLNNYSDKEWYHTMSQEYL
ncbi:hypothetical protein EV363DRAFT_1453089 [Boletus edulis]|nr:hypothetical protein EV363DRAFT_1453089 [Boletus edulis]